MPGANWVCFVAAAKSSNGNAGRMPRADASQDVPARDRLPRWPRTASPGRRRWPSASAARPLRASRTPPARGPSRRAPAGTDCPGRESPRPGRRRFHELTSRVADASITLRVYPPSTAKTTPGVARTDRGNDSRNRTSTEIRHGRTRSRDGRRILLVDDDRGLRHVLSTLLTEAGHTVTTAATARGHRPAGDGAVRHRRCVDIGLPSMSGLEVLAHARALPDPPLVIMMTADDTPETLLQAVRRQAYRYLRKPFAPNAVVDIVEEASAMAPRRPRCRSRSCRPQPEWLEIVAPCSLEMADRVQSFVMQLEADLPETVRESVAHGVSRAADQRHRVGRQARSQRGRCRISCVRAKRMLLYRIRDPGEGFDIDRLRHAAISNPDDDPIAAHGRARGAGPAPGRVRPGDDAVARRRVDLQRSAQRSDLYQVSRLTCRSRMTGGGSWHP